MRPILFLFAFIGISLVTCAQVVATEGTLTVSSTVSLNSVPYYYVVWIKDAQGSFLRTLTMYGQTSRYYSDLTNWYASGSANKTNAVTGATKSTPASYTSIWNAKNQANTTLVADGNYTFCIEVATEGASSKLVSGVFIKGVAAQTLSPAGLSPISNVSVKWVPVTTGIEDVQLAKLYTVYPNPTKSDVFVNGYGIKSLTLYSQSGKQLVKTILSTMNLANYPGGIYILKVETEAGSFFKKIEKL